MQADRTIAYPVRVPTGGVEVDGDLVVPDRVRGVVLFAHGSGSSRHSPRNRQVAAALQRAGYATLLMDLLTAAEETLDQRTREHRFDIGLLAGRLTAAVDLLAGRSDTAALPLALFGASTGAAAALVTAAERADRVRLVISRGGRPDLAGPALVGVQAPVLLLVGGADEEVLRLNREAAAEMSAPVDLRVVPGATHLFAEPGALEDVIDLAVTALDRHLPSTSDPSNSDGGVGRQEQLMTTPTPPIGPVPGPPTGPDPIPTPGPPIDPPGDPGPIPDPGPID